MSDGIPLFIAEPTGTCILRLRRFRYRREGEPPHHHDATVTIGENVTDTSLQPDGTRYTPGDLVPHDDPRWPATCSCGEPFRSADEWQVNEVPWYAGDGQRFAWGIGSWDGPPGAMIRAEWRDQEGRPPAWIVFLPNRTYWCTNDRATGEGNQLGPYWDVTGTAPALTVMPSINDTNPARPWHGWIRDGELRLA